MSSSEFNTVFRMFAEDMHITSEQSITANPHFQKLKQLNAPLSESIREIFEQHMPKKPETVEACPKSEIFVQLINKVIRENMPAKEFVDRFTEQALSIS